MNAIATMTETAKHSPIDPEPTHTVSRPLPDDVASLRTSTVDARLVGRTWTHEHDAFESYGCGWPKHERRVHYALPSTSTSRARAARVRRLALAVIEGVFAWKVDVLRIAAIVNIFVARRRKTVWQLAAAFGLDVRYAERAPLMSAEGPITQERSARMSFDGSIDGVDSPALEGAGYLVLPFDATDDETREMVAWGIGATVMRWFGLEPPHEAVRHLFETEIGNAIAVGDVELLRPAWQLDRNWPYKAVEDGETDAELEAQFAQCEAAQRAVCHELAKAHPLATSRMLFGVLQELDVSAPWPFDEGEPSTAVPAGEGRQIVPSLAAEGPHDLRTPAATALEAAA